jgi:predicted trehalose synthase
MDGVSSAVDDLRNLNLGENGIAALQDGLSQVSTQLDLLKGEVSAAVTPQVDAVTNAVHQVQQSAAAAQADPTAASLSTLRTDLGGLGTAVGNLGNALTSTC